MDLALQPMSTSQLLDRTFSIYRKNFFLFAGIAVLPPACLLLAELLIVVLGFTAMGKAGGPMAAAMAGVAMAGAFFVLGILWMAGTALTSGASVFGVWRVHLGFTATIRECFALIKGSFWRILGIELLMGIATLIVAGLGIAVTAGAVLGLGATGASTGTAVAQVLVGILLGGATVVAIFFTYAKLSLTIASCVVEGQGVFDSFRRSISLTEGTVFRIVLVALLAAVFTLVLSVVFSVIPYFLGIVLVVAKGKQSMLFPMMAVKYCGDFIASVLAYPIATIAVSLIYFDQRVRKEAFDLQFMMETMGQPAAAPPPPPPAAEPNIG